MGLPELDRLAQHRDPDRIPLMTDPELAQTVPFSGLPGHKRLRGTRALRPPPARQRPINTQDQYRPPRFIRHARGRTERQDPQGQIHHFSGLSRQVPG